MASNNRATIINKVLKVLKKQYKPAEINKNRTLFEHLIFACLLENSIHADADLVFEHLSKEYFDWNEVRVSTIQELAAAMKPLNDPEDSAVRLKRVLNSVFETHYSYDLEPLKKQNIGQTVKQIEKYNGSTGFTVAFVTQNALGGHSIPINQGLLESMRIVGVISDSEAKKGSVTGLERAVPKTKGVEIGTILHQLGVELKRSPHSPAVRKILLEIAPDCKDRLPKRATKKKPEPEKPKKETAPPAAKAKKKAPEKKAAPVKKKKVAKKAPAKPAKKKKVVKKKVVKKPVKKKVVKKKAKATPKTKKKTTNKKLSKRKPK